MEDIKFTPEGWHWKITPDQIEKIKARDLATVNQVYFDNLKKFKIMAYRYCGLTKKCSYFWDCVQQVYVDLIYYDYTNCKTLFWSIRHSFYQAIGSWRVSARSLDAPILDGDATLGDIIPAYDTADREQERKDNERHVLELIAAQSHLSNKSKDVLTAFALNCLVYEGLFEYEYRTACAS